MLLKTRLVIFQLVVGVVNRRPPGSIPEDNETVWCLRKSGDCYVHHIHYVRLRKSIEQHLGA